MNVIFALIYAIYFFSFSFLDKFRVNLVLSLKKLKSGLAQEGKETREMFNIYYQYLNGQASESDMNVANEQFRDLLRSMGLGAFLILPFAPVTIPIIIKLGRRLGIDIVPSSFRKKAAEKTDGPLGQ